MTVILGIIDGTGPFWDSSYESAMQHSFCKQMSKPTGQISNIKYLRGPSGDGFSTSRRASAIVDWARAEMAKTPDGRLYLAGYSRGAWGVTMAAETLMGHRIKVQALFLFDPVRMQAYHGGQVVPGNVQRVYIARRKHRAQIMNKYNWDSSVLDGSMNPVREWWGVTSLNISHIPGAEKSFLGSHGALGGVGWQGIKEDQICQPLVAAFMNRAFAAEHLGLNISSISFPSQFEGIKSDWSALKAHVISGYQFTRAELGGLANKR
jgi:pimeloyl-ACP methyl ester carboxylesterase